MTLKLSIIFSSLLLLNSKVVFAEIHSYSPAVGIEVATINGDGESRISLSLSKAASGIGKIGAVSANSIRIQGANWSFDQYGQKNGHPAYYAEFSYSGTGQIEGAVLPIWSNGSDVLTFGTDNRVSAILSQVGLGDVVKIRPGRTVSDTFGENEDLLKIGSVSRSPSLGDGADRLWIEDSHPRNVAGGPVNFLFYISGTGWYSKASPAESGTSEALTPIFPSDVLKIQRFSGSDSKVIIMGEVDGTSHTLVLPAISADREDVPIAIRGAIPLTLEKSGLGDVMGLSPSKVEWRDQILWWNNDRPGIARPPDRIFLYVYGVGWWDATRDEDATAFVLQPGCVVTLRRRSGIVENIWRQR